MRPGMIFDLDGVLVDTARFHYLAWKRLAKEAFGFNFTPRDNEAFKGVNRASCMRLLMKMAAKDLPAAEADRLAAQKNEWYVEMVRDMSEADVLPGARDFLRACRARGLKTAIGSASKNCGLVLERTGIASLFDAVVDGNAVSRAKPDPQVFLQAAQALFLPPGRCVVFEDAQAGIDAARAGGMIPVGIAAQGALKGCRLCAPSLNALSLDDVLRLLPPG